MNARGYTLLEAVVAVAILGILSMIAAPSFTAWVNRSQVGTMAESIQSGLTQARMEAVKRNRPVTFTLSDQDLPSCDDPGASTSGTNWIICVTEDAVDSAAIPDPIVGGKNGSAAVTVNAGFSTITFDGMGRADSGDIVEIEICKGPEGQSEHRRRRILLTSSGSVNNCDPALPANKQGACKDNSPSNSNSKKPRKCS